MHRGSRNLFFNFEDVKGNPAWTEKCIYYYIDDVLIQNGKIVLYDENQCQFPAPIAK
ncbi:MAG TPA: hypothetical protein VF301_10020 [Ginsengibacter sp.]